MEGHEKTPINYEH